MSTTQEAQATGRARRARWLPNGGAGDRPRLPRHELLPDQRADQDRKWVLLAVLVLWEAVMRIGLISDLFFAAPSQVATAFWELAQDAQIRSAIWSAMVMFVTALAGATVAGVLFGAFLGLTDLAYRSLHPIVIMFFATPSMIFIPLVILVLGTGFEAKVLYGAVAGFFPIVVTVTAGVRSVNPKLRSAAYSMGAGRWQMIRYVLLPGSLPAVFAAFWYGIKHCLLGVLIMELFMSQFGIGYFMRSYTAAFRMDRVLALVLTVSLVAIGFATIWRRVEQRAMRWQPSP